MDKFPLQTAISALVHPFSTDIGLSLTTISVKSLRLHHFVDVLISLRRFGEIKQALFRILPLRPLAVLGFPDNAFHRQVTFFRPALVGSGAAHHSSRASDH